MTEVVNFYHIQNNQLHYLDVYIGRAGKGQDGYFGNPFPIRKDLSTDEARKLCIDQYRVYFFEKIRTDQIFRDRIKSLKGKRLVCFCKPKACHGDVIKEYLDSLDD